MYSLPFFGMSGGGNTEPTFDGVDDYLQFLGANLWLDAADDDSVITAVGTNPPQVTQWTDKSGNGNSPAQTSSSAQPTYANNTISFTSTRFLAITSKQVFAGATSGSVFFVGRQPTASGYGGGWGTFGNTVYNEHTPSTNGAMYTVFLNSSRPQVTAAGSVPYPMPFSVVSFEHNGSTLTARRNGSLLGSTSVGFYIPPLNDSFRQRIGGQEFTFDHQEILMFPSVLSESDRQIIEGYLAHKWGLVANLPTNHPYKSVTPAISPTQLRIEATTPSLNIKAVSQTFTFTVARGGNLNKQSFVTYTTGTTNRLTVVATDFVGDVFPSGSLSFDVGETSKTISIQIKQSNSSKEFAVTLSDAVYADIAVGTATATGFSDVAISGYLTNLSPSLWLDAADADRVQTAVGTNRVVQWTDKSGNNRHATQGNTALQPAYQNNAIVFTGSHFLGNQSTQEVFNIREGHLFVVYQQTVNTVNSGIFNMRGDSGADWQSSRNFVLHPSADGGIGVVGYSNNLVMDTAVNTTSLIMHSFERIGTAPNIGAKLRRHGTIVSQTTSNSFSTSFSSTYGLGGRDNGNTPYLQGRIHEVIHLNRVLSEGDRQIIEGYLAHKWGLVANLPTNHPYKSAAPF